mmetsp:Transcript_70805/g.124963  ORF Transcript_70805/g.124963 Transcript_70805/m.124963 type:complete len:201 (+) Transcript_70805:99-701(+)
MFASAKATQSAFDGNAHCSTSASSDAKCCTGCSLRQREFCAYSWMFPDADFAIPSKEASAAPRSRVRARKTERCSSASSAFSIWSTIASLSLMDSSVSSCAAFSRPKGSRSPNGREASDLAGALFFLISFFSFFGAGAAGAASSSPSSSSSTGVLFFSFFSAFFSAFGAEKTGVSLSSSSSFLASFAGASSSSSSSSSSS